MALLEEDYCDVRDIDWYCTINGHPICIASKGGYIPQDYRERIYLRDLQRKVLNLPYASGVTLRHNEINQQIAGHYDYIDEQELENDINRLFANVPSFNYLQNQSIALRLFTRRYVDKARRGFYAYARIIGSNDYFLVARPTDQVVLPEDLDLRPLNVNSESIPDVIHIGQHMEE